VSPIIVNLDLPAKKSVRVIVVPNLYAVQKFDLTSFSGSIRVWRDENEVVSDIAFDFSDKELVDTSGRLVIYQEDNPFYDIARDYSKHPYAYGDTGYLLGFHEFMAIDNFTYADETLMVTTYITASDERVDSSDSTHVLEKEISMADYEKLLRDNVPEDKLKLIMFSFDDEELDSYIPEKLIISLSIETDKELDDAEYIMFIQSLAHIYQMRDLYADYRELDHLLNNPDIKDSEKMKAAYLATGIAALKLNHEFNDLDMALLENLTDGEIRK
jgi:hypothetical protein